MVFAKCHPAKQHYAKGLCISCYSVRWVKNSPKKYSINRNSRLKKSFGIDLIEYERLLEEQNFKCKICGIKPDSSIHPNGVATLEVDHDHKTGTIRGLLCGKCNRALGHVNDNKDILLAMIAYLDNSSLIDDLQYVTI
jgi:hypothetical protein